VREQAIARARGLRIGRDPGKRSSRGKCCACAEKSAA
jgi:hypothetical protein